MEGEKRASERKPNVERVGFVETADNGMAKRIM